MKKFLLLTAVAFSMLMYACKKDSTTETNTPVPQDTITAPLIDPVALASNVKIGYGGTSVNGTFPATTTAAATPVLDSIYNGREYTTVNNRYVVIYPRVMSGFISGYYLKINGAASYFKIDYTAASGLRKANQNKQGLKDEVNNIDSSIIIKLPAGLKGDTFSVKYAAYDSLNNVSNTITAIVHVIAPANSSDDALLQGSWHRIAYKNYENDDWNIISEKDSGRVRYYVCVDNKPQLSQNGEPIEELMARANNVNTNTYDLQFLPDNACNQKYHQINTTLDLESSTCDNFIYTVTRDETDIYSGGYSYDAVTKVITLVKDEDNDYNYFESIQYHVKELTSTKLVFYEIYSRVYTHGELELEYTEFTKNK
jgi:hypothetical protein